MPKELEFAHHVEDFGSLHACAPELIVSGAIGDRRMAERQRIRRKDDGCGAWVAMPREDVDDHVR